MSYEILTFRLQVYQAFSNVLYTTSVACQWCNTYLKALREQKKSRNFLIYHEMCFYIILRNNNIFSWSLLNWQSFIYDFIIFFKSKHSILKVHRYLCFRSFYPSSKKKTQGMFLVPKLRVLVPNQVFTIFRNDQVGANGSTFLGIFK